MDVVFLFRLKNVHLLPAIGVWKKFLLLMLLLHGPFPLFIGPSMTTQLLPSPLLHSFAPGDTLQLGQTLISKKKNGLSLIN